MRSFSAVFERFNNLCLQNKAPKKWLYASRVMNVLLWQFVRDIISKGYPFTCQVFKRDLPPQL